MPLPIALRSTVRRHGMQAVAGLWLLASPALGQQPAMPEASPQGRAVLYEEDANTPAGRSLAGVVEWQLLPARGKTGTTILANVKIPGRPIGLSFLLYRNDDPAVAASHVIDLIFEPPSDSGGIEQSPGILMKPAENVKGEPLTASSVKLTTNQFVIRLSNAPADLSKNLTLLRDRSWIDIPIVYGNKKRAIIAVEKGLVGIKAFGDMLASQAPPPAASPQPPQPAASPPPPPPQPRRPRRAAPKAF